MTKKEYSISMWGLIKKILSFAKKFKKPFAIIFACVFLSTGLSAINNILLSKIFDIVPFLVQKNEQGKTFLTSAFVLAAITTALAFLRTMVYDFQGKIEVRYLDKLVPNFLNSQSIQKYFSFSNGQHINEHSGVKQSIITTGIASIKSQIDSLVYNTLPVFIQIIISLIVIMYASPVIGIFCIIMGSISLYFLYQHNTKTIPGLRKLQKKSLKKQRIVSEMFRFVSFIKNENQEIRSLRDVNDVQDEHQAMHIDVWIPGIKRLLLVRIVSNVLHYFSIFIAIFLLYRGNLTIGALFLIVSYVGQLSELLWQITSLHKQFLLDRVNIEKYLEILEARPDIVFVDNPISIPKLEGKIEFVDVSFWYPKRNKETNVDVDDDLDIQNEPILNKVSFTILPGEKVGMVGESGSGKSTIANLIRRSFDPQSGRILVDGHDLRLIDLGEFLCHIGSVEQEVVLFDRSLKENIIFGANRDIDYSELLELLKQAGIDSFFEKFEHGFNTMVGEKGVKLSGGERQRVGIARALAKKPSVLIFDEATSALDSMSERSVQESIDSACAGKTSIVIAHRLSTVKNCDRILVFRNGVLLDQGTHEELLKKCEYYSELVHHQMVEQE